MQDYKFDVNIENSCVNDIINGTRYNLVHNSYVLNGNMYAVMDIGKLKDSQDDSVLILTHHKNENITQLKFNEEIKRISLLIETKYNKGQSSFSGALVTKNKTIISNVGNSSIYTYKDNNLIRITKEQTLDNCILLDAVGNTKCEIVSNTIENNSYDMLLLF